MSTRTDQRPVLILGAAARIAIPIARLLQKRCGVSVDVAAINAADPPLSSRAIRKFLRLSYNPSCAEEFSSKLMALVQKENFDMIIPVQDAALAALRRNYAQLSAVTHVACPPPHIVDRVLDKSITLELAQQCGIRVPKTCRVSNCAELPKSLQFPVVLKPAESKDSGKLKVAYFKQRQELIAWLDNNAGDRQFLVQEYCPGEGVGVEMLIHAGECVASFQHRRLKEHPASGGVAVVAIAESSDPVLRDASLRLLKALEWEGVAMVEYRRNPSDGSFALMEVNGRFWGTTALPLLAGVEFPVYQWQILHDQLPSPPGVYKTGLRWRWSAGYLERTHQLLSRKRRVAAGLSLWKELADIPFDMSPAVRDAVWSFSDPIPGLSDFSRTIQAILKSDYKSLVQKLGLHRRMSSPSHHGTASTTLKQKSPERTEDDPKQRSEVEISTFDRPVV